MLYQAPISRVARRIKFLFIVFCLGLDGCSNNCDEQCFTPPQNFQFELIDKSSGENLFTNSTFDPLGISITDELNNNSSVEFTFISENELNLIQIGSIGWESEIVDLRIEVSGNYVFNFYVNAERKSEDCCDFTDYNEITIKNSDFDLNTETGIYRILIE
jgi:hypothetical protein